MNDPDNYNCQTVNRTSFQASIYAFFRRNRDRKKELEMDWSDKKEADEMDSFCAGLRNEHTCKQFFAGAAKFQEM